MQSSLVSNLEPAIPIESETPRNGRSPLQRLMESDGLHAVFQPLVDLRNGSVYGHEALIRGPVDGPLHMPLALFECAASESVLMEFELRCVDVILREWLSARLPGNLFVNLSADALVRASATVLPRMLASSGVDPRKLVIELTENERATDPQSLIRVVDAMGPTGVRLALDDFGDGHSNLRRWAELKPRFVKLDKFLTRNVTGNRENFEMVRAVVALSEAFGTQLVAEGIETGDDLRTLRDLGVAIGQGYFLGRPARTPPAVLPRDAADVLADRRLVVLPMPGQLARPGILRNLVLVKAPAVEPGTTNEEVAAIFQAQPELHALAVVHHGKPVALVNRREFTDHFARLYFREVHGRKACISHANRTPRVIDLDDDVSELMGILTSDDQRYLSEGFVVAEQGKYLGLGTGEQLVRAVTETRIEAARHANPLTFLPGNIPISLHIERLLSSGIDFVAGYADLNDFKPFNDHYGYWRGDEVIRTVARLLVANCDACQDFVGHVGGDDFIVLFQGDDWEARCRRVIDEFASQAIGLYDEADRLAGGIRAEDRHGTMRFFPCATLCIGAVHIAPGTCRTVEDVATEAARAKHGAKTAASGLAVYEADGHRIEAAGAAC
ncbi:EAL domain-containing protein (putative c-di-GMP-specific phosphodiesterase class I)/GGDEF domain-containing protein [Variovorax sp. GrIS 2.14]|uniref:EAL domain-containing protein n=1 Tax=Variovorax sp. GrIS 2.14 TaxID=3071709 RepID=UPI0038F6893F